MTLARRPRARTAIRAVLTLSWLALACRGAPLAGPPAPSLSIDGVPIHDWHLAHIDKLVACMQRHGPLRRDAWRQEWSSDAASLRLPLTGDSQSGWIRVFWRYRADGEPGTAFGLELSLRSDRVELTYAEEIPGGGPEPAGGVSYFVGGRRPEFWIDLEGPDPFALLHDPARAREAARAALAAHEHREEAQIEGLGACDARLCKGPVYSDRIGARLAAHDSLRADMARRHEALERGLTDLLAEVRDLYPIDDPACALALPARTRDP